MEATRAATFAGTMPELYERHLVTPLFRPFAQELLQAAGVTHSLLDVACGTGIVARLARGGIAERGAVVGVDASAGMLAVAKAAAPEIDWRQGDATRLPIADNEKFDVVTCHQGLQFFADKPAAIAEMRRVLGRNGRLAVATWRPIEEVPLMRDLKRVAIRHLGEFVDQRHSFGVADTLARLLKNAGFGETHVTTVTRTVCMNDGAAALTRLNAMAMTGMSPAARTMTDAQRAQTIDAIVEDSAGVIAPYVRGSDVIFEISTNIAIAR